MALIQVLADTLPAAWGRVEALAGVDETRHLQAALADRDLLDEVESWLAASPFFAEQMARNAHWVAQQLDTEWLNNRHWSAAEWLAQGRISVGQPDDESSFMSALRRFRGREMLRLLWRDFSRRADLDDTLRDISDLADCVIRLALERAERQLEPRYGHPIGRDSGTRQELVVLGMGKLGGRELNLSSDIDLIFTYPESGQTEGGRNEVSNQEYFIKVGQTVIRLLDAVTADGFVFRVDMRLRPYGDSGALVSNYDSLEIYYQEQGREWERYALMKARPITGSEAAIAPLKDMIRAFVYRRYTDFGVIESLRDMKAMIVAEVRRLGLADNIKKGPGGIREIEFIAQCIQLIHGGRIPELRQRGLVAALNALCDHNLLSAEAVAELVSAYRWLRNLEHALQGMEDKQTQTLPADPLARARLAVIMGVPDWQALMEVLDSERARVCAHFADLIAPAEPELAEQTALLSFAELSAGSLAQLEFKQPEDSWQALADFLDSARIRVLQGDSRQRVERFLPRLCEAVAEVDAPDLALQRLLPFVAAVSRRSAYLVLLEENPPALSRLVELARQSPWIAQKLAARPDLLDELLDADRLTTAPDRDDMQSLVRQQLLRVPEDDLEAQMIALGRIKDSVVLRVAASELTGRLPIMKVSDYLTFLAEVILQQAIHVARAELVQRHGEPQGDRLGFAVLGYGKLGGIELSYGSDLDLVFVYEGGEGETAGPRVIDNIRFYTRLAQRVVHVLSTMMAGGRLYEVDLRLRPHGNSGLVAVSLSGLRKYQFESAWIWEHQALVRTRPIAGDRELLDALTGLRAEVLAQARDQSQLAAEVVNMRRRMLSDGLERIDAAAGFFDLKRDPGGIVDIEFVVQYLVLAHAHAHPELTQWSDVVRILESLQSAQVLPVDEADALKAAYLAYRSAVHVSALSGEQAVGAEDDYREHLQQVSAIRDRWLPGVVDAESGDTDAEPQP